MTIHRTAAAATLTAALILALPLAASPVGQDPTTHAPGIYVETPGAGGTTLARLAGSRPQEVKTKGLGKMILSQGLLKASNVWSLGGPMADLRITNATPTFHFYFDTSSQSSGAAPADPMAALAQMMNADVMPASARTAGDFALVRLEVVDDNRQVNMGKVTSSAPKPKNAVACTEERLAQGAYTLQPKSPLAPGEYAFFYIATMGAMGGGYQAWDFGVDAPK
jgi:hypothetical protein